MMEEGVGFPCVAPTLCLLRGLPTTHQGIAAARPAGLQDLVQGRRGTHQLPWGAVRWSEALHRDAIEDGCTAEPRPPTMG
jgi:hypothetical protein